MRNDKVFLLRRERLVCGSVHKSPQKKMVEMPSLSFAQSQHYITQSKKTIELKALLSYFDLGFSIG